jgi:hypothetical protein
MNYVGFEPTTAAIPTHIFYVADEDAAAYDGGSTTSCPLIV